MSARHLRNLVTLSGAKLLTERSAWLKLHPVFAFRPPQNLHPFPGRGVEPRDMLWIVRRQSRSIVVVPSDLYHFRSGGSFLGRFRGHEDRERLIGHDGYPLVAAGMRVDLDTAEIVERIRRLRAKDVGCAEAVDQQGRSAFAVRVREYVEGLQACGIGEIGVVGMRSEGQRCVGSVLQ